jgi:hypothetical protein
MDNGERVLSMRGASRSLGLKGGGSVALARNLNNKGLSPYLSQSLRDWLDMVKREEAPRYISTLKSPFIPFETSLFVDLCRAYVDAWHDGALVTDTQKAIAVRLYDIMTAFAKVGLTAIIDEVTGYQDYRNRNELQKILAKYINEDLLPWTKGFPDEFYKQMFRLKGWNYRGKEKPSFAGKITNDYVYEYLPDGVLEDLRKHNPSTSQKGRRQHKHHQFLTTDTGVVHLDNQLKETIALMKGSETWDEFDRIFHRAFGEPPRMRGQDADMLSAT